jgi:hypothetical protein
MKAVQEMFAMTEEFTSVTVICRDSNQRVSGKFHDPLNNRGASCGIVPKLKTATGFRDCCGVWESQSAAEKQSPFSEP